MGAPWRPVIYGGKDPDMARLIDRLNKWARDKDRLESSLTTPASVTGTSSMALNARKIVSSTRVTGLVNGSTSSSGASLMPEGVDGSLQFKSSASLDGDPELTWHTGTAHLGVTGSIHVTSGVTIDGTLSVGLSAFLPFVSSGTTFAGQAVFPAGISVSGGASFWDAVSGLSIAEGITVSGVITCLSGLSIASGSTFSGQLGVIGGVTLKSTLYVGGILTFNGNIIPASSTENVGSAAKPVFNVFGGTATFDHADITGLSAGANGIQSAGPVVVNSSLTVGTQGLQDNGGFAGTSATFSGGVTFSGQVGMAAGLTVGGGLTSSGLLAGLAGLSVSGSTITLYPGANNAIIAGASVFRPSINSVQNWGALNFRPANIFGTTANFNSTVTAGSTCKLGGSGTTSTCNGDWQFTSNVTVGGNLVPASSILPQLDFVSSLGEGHPAVSFARWSTIAAGLYFGATVGILATGTTLDIHAVESNYLELTGTNTVAGITQANQAADTGGTVYIFGLSSNPKFQHGVQFNLTGGVTFSGRTGDHIAFIGSGGDKWREIWRTRASGQLFQPTGSNKPMGVATLVGGSVTVSNTLVGSSTHIFLTEQNGSANIGSPYITSRTAGASFAIASTNILDASDVAWLLVEPEGL